MGVRIYTVTDTSGKLEGYQPWDSVTGLPLVHVPTPTVTALEAVTLDCEDQGLDPRAVAPAILQEMVAHHTVASGGPEVNGR